jgi:hypothetical protein
MIFLKNARATTGHSFYIVYVALSLSWKEISQILIGCTRQPTNRKTSETTASNSAFRFEHGEKDDELTRLILVPKVVESCVQSAK